LIDWSLTPTFAVLQLYRNIIIEGLGPFITC